MNDGVTTGRWPWNRAPRRVRDRRCRGVVFGLLVQAAAAPAASDTLWAALTEGTPDLAVRWRYERVEDDQVVNGQRLRDATASTVRTAIGYRTRDHHGLAARVQIEAIGALGSDDYFDGAGARNADRATIVDPRGVELNEAYLSYRADTKLELRGGRQSITYRKAPLHRFMGNVLWRQNWQTHDAATAVARPTDDLVVSYGYIWRVHRIFGDDAPEPLSEFDSDSHVVNVQYAGFPHLRLEAYAYLLDFANAARFSSHTYGIRASGAYPLQPKWSLLYTLEYARQAEAGNNPFAYDEDYVLFEGGVRREFGRYVRSIALKFTHERLGGSGRRNGAFVTVLGTNHAFQGWADRFLVTPDAGVRDHFLTAIVELAGGMKLVGAYHDLAADAGGFDYGEELDVELTKSFLKHYQVGAKAAFYHADRGPRNVAGPPAADARVYWVWGQLSF